MLNGLASLAIQQAFSKPCLVNLISKDTHLVFLYLNAHADISGKAVGLNVSLSIHSLLNFVYASSKGSGESAHLCRLTWAFVAWICNKDLNPMASLYVLVPTTIAINILQAPQIRAVTENYLSLFSAKTYVVGTQKRQFFLTKSKHMF